MHEQGTGAGRGEDTVRHADEGPGGTFYVEQGGARVAELTYRRAGRGRIVLDHTFVDDSLRGRGVGRDLVHAAVAWARGTGAKVVPSCPYARALFDKEPALREVEAAED